MYNIFHVAAAVGVSAISTFSSHFHRYNMCLRNSSHIYFFFGGGGQQVISDHFEDGHPKNRWVRYLMNRWFDYIQICLIMLKFNNVEDFLIFFYVDFILIILRGDPLKTDHSNLGFFMN